MAIPKNLVASIFLVIFVISVTTNAEDRTDPTHGGGQGPNIDCPGLCEYRCHLSSHRDTCKRSCNTCCQRCQCVPPGTAGNADVCPCYAKMTTHGGRPKCP